MVLKFPNEKVTNAVNM